MQQGARNLLIGTGHQVCEDPDEGALNGSKAAINSWLQIPLFKARESEVRTPGPRRLHDGELFEPGADLENNDSFSAVTFLK